MMVGDGLPCYCLKARGLDKRKTLRRQEIRTNDPQSQCDKDLSS